MKFQPETLAGLIAKGLQLWVWCDECCHNAIEDPAALGFPASTPVPLAGRWFYCSRCKHTPAFTRPKFPDQQGGLSPTRVG